MSDMTSTSPTATPSYLLRSQRPSRRTSGGCSSVLSAHFNSTFVSLYHIPPLHPLLINDQSLFSCFSFLDETSLRSASLVSTNWSRLSNASLLWKPLCEQLWKNKEYKGVAPVSILGLTPFQSTTVSSTTSTRSPSHLSSSSSSPSSSSPSPSPLPSSSSLSSLSSSSPLPSSSSLSSLSSSSQTTKNWKKDYYRSIRDGKREFIFRCEVIAPYLPCWSFRFKENAGDSWLSACPWRAGGDAATVSMLADGSVQLHSKRRDAQRLADALGIGQDGSGGGGDGGGGDGGANVERDLWQHVPTNFDLQWRLGWRTKSKKNSRVMALYLELMMGRKPNEMEVHAAMLVSGDCLRLSLNGVPVPTYLLSRSPTGNWGFCLESCWALYTSWAMPRMGVVPLMEDDLLSVTTQQQLREVNLYNTFVATADVDDDAEYIA